MRIVAGSAKGRPLQGPTWQGLRPTADRVRETVFNVLGQALDPVDVLDLYAGTGALALEALSRGAARAVLVDKDRLAIDLCRKNALATGFEGQVELLNRGVDKACVELGRSGRTFELIFADPPYAARVVEAVLEQVTANALLASTGTVVVEHDKRETAPETFGPLRQIDQRRFGDTLVTMYQHAPA